MPDPMSIHHPNGVPNHAAVTLGNLTVFFSFEAPIAFQVHGDRLFLRTNRWGNSTKRHYNGLKTSHPVYTELSEEQFLEHLSQDLENVGAYLRFQRRKVA